MKVGRVGVDRAMRGFLRLVLRTFFREIEIIGDNRVPEDRGGLFLSWHPNALIDPTLIVVASPRPVAFGARHGLLRVPLLGTLMRAVGTVPIYRAVDIADRSEEERREANRRSLDALAERIAGGVFSGLFPEGLSHDESHLVELKTGAARLYYRARQLTSKGSPVPAIVPVGLHYDQKRVFRSRAVVWFHEALELPKELDVTPPDDEAPEAGRERARALTDFVGMALHDAVHATDDWETRHLLNRCRKLFRAETAHRAGLDPGPPRAAVRTAGFAVVRAVHDEMSEPERKALLDRVRSYDADLTALGLDDHHLDRGPALVSPRLVLLLLLQTLIVFVVLPPVIVLGVIANAPTAALVAGLARLGAEKGKDLASLKVMAGAVLYPLTWIAVGVIAAVGWGNLADTWLVLPNGVPWVTGVVTGLLAAVGGYLSLHYVRAAREITRAVRVRLTRRRQKRAVERLRVERGKIHDEMVRHGEALGLDDPTALVRELSNPPPA